jgi:glyoxylase-like metal-dependent hydrolase (beta-lactamase superfamily II)
VRFVDDLVKPLEDTGLLDLIEADTNVTDEVTTLHTPGHTPGHLCVIVSSSGEKAIIWGDAFLHPAQMTEPDWASPFPFDQDGEEATRCRHGLLDRIESEGMAIAACHFPEPGFGRVARIKGRRYWRSVMPSR